MQKKIISIVDNFRHSQPVSLFPLNYTQISRRILDFTAKLNAPLSETEILVTHRGFIKQVVDVLNWVLSCNKNHIPQLVDVSLTGSWVSYLLWGIPDVPNDIDIVIEVDNFCPQAFLSHWNKMQGLKFGKMALYKCNEGAQYGFVNQIDITIFNRGVFPSRARSVFSFDSIKINLTQLLQTDSVDPLSENFTQFLSTISGFSLAEIAWHLSQGMAISEKWESVTKGCDRTVKVQDRIPGFRIAQPHLAYLWDLKDGDAKLTIEWWVDRIASCIHDFGTVPDIYLKTRLLLLESIGLALKVIDITYQPGGIPINADFFKQRAIEMGVRDDPIIEILLTVVKLAYINSELYGAVERDIGDLFRYLGFPDGLIDIYRSHPHLVGHIVQLSSSMQDSERSLVFQAIECVKNRDQWYGWLSRKWRMDPISIQSHYWESIILRDIHDGRLQDVLVRVTHNFRWDLCDDPDECLSKMVGTWRSLGEMREIWELIQSPYLIPSDRFSLLVCAIEGSDLYRQWAMSHNLMIFLALNEWIDGPQLALNSTTDFLLGLIADPLSLFIEIWDRTLGSNAVPEWILSLLRTRLLIANREEVDVLSGENALDLLAELLEFDDENPPLAQIQRVFRKVEWSTAAFVHCQIAISLILKYPDRNFWQQILPVFGHGDCFFDDQMVLSFIKTVDFHHHQSLIQTVFHVRGELSIQMLVYLLQNFSVPPDVLSLYFNKKSGISWLEWISIFRGALPMNPDILDQSSVIQLFLSTPIRRASDDEIISLLDIFLDTKWVNLTDVQLLISPLLSHCSTISIEKFIKLIQLAKSTPAVFGLLLTYFDDRRIFAYVDTIQVSVHCELDRDIPECCRSQWNHIQNEIAVSYGRSLKSRSLSDVIVAAIWANSTFRQLDFHAVMKILIHQILNLSDSKWVSTVNLNSTIEMFSDLEIKDVVKQIFGYFDTNIQDLSATEIQGIWNWCKFTKNPGRFLAVVYHCVESWIDGFYEFMFTSPHFIREKPKLTDIICCIIIENSKNKLFERRITKFANCLLFKLQTPSFKAADLDGVDRSVLESILGVLLQKPAILPSKNVALLYGFIVRLLLQYDIVGSGNAQLDQLLLKYSDFHGFQRHQPGMVSHPFELRELAAVAWQPNRDLGAGLEFIEQLHCFFLEYISKFDTANGACGSQFIAIGLIFYMKLFKYPILHSGGSPQNEIVLFKYFNEFSNRLYGKLSEIFETFEPVSYPIFGSIINEFLMHIKIGASDRRQILWVNTVFQLLVLIIGFFDINLRVVPEFAPRLMRYIGTCVGGSTGNDRLILLIYRLFGQAQKRDVVMALMKSRSKLECLSVAFDMPWAPLRTGCLEDNLGMLDCLKTMVEVIRVQPVTVEFKVRWISNLPSTANFFRSLSADSTQRDLILSRIQEIHGLYWQLMVSLVDINPDIGDDSNLPVDLVMRRIQGSDQFLRMLPSAYLQTIIGFVFETLVSLFCREAGSIACFATARGAINQMTGLLEKLPNYPIYVKNLGIFGLIHGLSQSCQLMYARHKGDAAFDHVYDQFLKGRLAWIFQYAACILPFSREFSGSLSRHLTGVTESVKKMADIVLLVLDGDVPVDSALTVIELIGQFNHHCIYALEYLSAPGRLSIFDYCRMACILAIDIINGIFSHQKFVVSAPFSLGCEPTSELVTNAILVVDQFLTAISNIDPGFRSNLVAHEVPHEWRILMMVKNQLLTTKWILVGILIYPLRTEQGGDDSDAGLQSEAIDHLSGLSLVHCENLDNSCQPIAKKFYYTLMYSSVQADPERNKVVREQLQLLRDLLIPRR